ncbi:MAG: S41 family peptidase [Cellvibrionaceae bacterium]
MTLFRHLSCITALTTLSLCFSLPVLAQDAKPTAEPSANASNIESSDPLPLQDLRLFTLIFDHIRRSYVEPVTDQELLENAVKGMLQELDPHSDYLDASHFSNLQESTQGQFSGVGLEIGQENGYIKVITPIDGSPAKKAGLQAGDLVIKLDNQSIRGLSLSEAAKKMRGPKGTEVIFTVIRQGLEKAIDITVMRDTIQTRSVRSRTIEDDFGYVRISQFQANTGKDFVTAISKLLKENKQLKGIVLDLRNNPGGVLQASVEVVDALVNDGLIVYTEGRLDNSNQSFSATTGDIAQGLPMVVLINGGSASAAEIVAGALQDQQRAIIMGTRSFGKGSVQTVLPVGKDKGIKLTTALYFTPEGRSIQAQGIEPDVIIERATITQLGGDARVKEADLSGHLANGNGDEDVKPSTKKSRSQNTEDNQLFEALNMLKGLAIFNKAAKKSNN